jgi:hypothetical protein
MKCSCKIQRGGDKIQGQDIRRILTSDTSGENIVQLMLHWYNCALYSCNSINR